MLKEPNVKLSKPGQGNTRRLEARDFESVDPDDVARVLRVTKAEGDKVVRINVPYEHVAFWTDEVSRHPPLAEKKVKKNAND